jgi:acetylornithine deacetylase/succinyl-diaminopimelate desuccinylase-like protein
MICHPERSERSERSRGTWDNHARVPGPSTSLAMLAALGMTAFFTASAQPYHALGRTILKELIETNTTASSGNTTIAAEILAKRFRAAGFPATDVQVVGPSEKNRNLVVRYRGRGAAKPILFLAHLDVVEAKRDDWTVDPFTLTEQNGYFYGRGTQDIKGCGTTIVAAFLRLKQEGYVPDRDLIFAFTAGEEGGMEYIGADWLIKTRRDLIDAEYTINVDAGGGESEKGERKLFDVQAAEKVYHTVTLTAKNSGGHSSLPRPDNAIYELATALGRLAKYEFPAKPSELTRAYFAKAALAAKGQMAADMKSVAAGKPDAAAITRLSKTPLYNSILRTTCVATMLEGGHAENALPQTAKATVNCRILPGEDPVVVEKTIKRVIVDTAIQLTPVGSPTPSPPSPLRPDLFAVIDATVKQLWGPLPIVPFMETGATDGLFLRNAGIPVYGFCGLFIDTDDIRAHGKDERIRASAFDGALDFMYDFIRRLSR